VHTGCRKARPRNGGQDFPLSGTERIRTAPGHIEAVRLDGAATQSDDPSRRYQLHLWLSADARRLPVAMAIETRLGSVRAELASAAPP
jgi:hypothetical protein